MVYSFDVYFRFRHFK